MKTNYKITLPVGVKDLETNLKRIQEKSLELQELLLINREITSKLGNITTEEV